MVGDDDDYDDDDDDDDDNDDADDDDDNDDDGDNDNNDTDDDVDDKTVNSRGQRKKKHQKSSVFYSVFNTSQDSRYFLQNRNARHRSHRHFAKIHLRKSMFF